MLFFSGEFGDNSSFTASSLKSIGHCMSLWTKNKLLQYIEFTLCELAQATKANAQERHSQAEGVYILYR